ncbi:hypothetical protein [Mucilaginibacter flavidus]|uniref:hypothetical protein n=1 Tax=Mucilaginibacter flavidus TaxID=2949309 RepID=UPI002093BBB1|nr:hypothetical protein [Mucilaginibacter flavidus]MCO5949234.1 hypothetical protein [Mucilaginibacter flavidus]
MDTTVTSSFNSRYFARAICGAAFFVWCTGYMLYHCLRGDFAHPAQAYGLTALLCGSVWVYYYFFSKSWQRVVVAETGITVFRAFKKPITIPYADITHIGTSRTRGSGGSGALAQSFYIEFNNDQSVSFNEAWYDNYDKLTMTIYLHKFGPGHGRERYLARH